MALVSPPVLIAGAFVLNLAIGAVLVLGVFAFMERRVAVGAAAGIVVGTTVVYGQATLGEQLLQPTVGEMKLLVLSAALGSVVGVVGTVLTVEPEL